MGQLSPYLRRTTKGYSHYCPGCDEMHSFYVDQPHSRGAIWTFDGNVESPTFTPSMNIGNGWCHYNLKAGVIEFLDCHHKLAGMKVPLPKLPPEYCDEP